MINGSTTGSCNDPLSTLPTIQVIQADCREAVPKQGKFDLIFADPPFNIGMLECSPKSDACVMKVS